jgi:hypothetical protein
MRTIDEVCVENLTTGERWLPNEIAEEHGRLLTVLVGAPPSLSFLGIDDRYVIRGRTGGEPFASKELALDVEQSEEGVEFVFRRVRATARAGGRRGA